MRTSPMSAEIGLIAELVRGATADAGLHLARDRARTLLKRLHLIRRAVHAMETELGAHRAREANRMRAATLEDLSGAVVGCAADGPSNVIHPQFGRR